MKKTLIGFGLVFLWITAAFAIPIEFFGEDAGMGAGTRLPKHLNADAARDQFLSNLIGVGTEDFEGLADGTPAPLTVDFGSAGNASLTGSGQVKTLTGAATDAGRYPISGDNYWDAGTSSFSIEFSNPISAFGFYGTDIRDGFFQGQVTLTYLNTASGLPGTTININNSIPDLGGNVIYFGFIDIDTPFNKIVFGNTGDADFFGFDDFAIGTKEQVTSAPVPEPSTMLLLGSGLIGLLGFRRKFRK